MEDIVLVGAGGHAKCIVDSIEKQNNYHIVGFTEQTVNMDIYYKNYKIIGDDSILKELFSSGVKNAFVAMGYMGNGNVRRSLFMKLKQIGYHLPVILDPTAAIAADVQIGEGTYIGKQASVNADTIVGKMCIVNDGAIVSHGCKLGDFSHVAVGAVICGDVKIGEETLIGANATILQGTVIGKHVKIGAGATVLDNVTENNTVVGIWKKVKMHKKGCIYE